MSNLKIEKEISDSNIKKKLETNIIHMKDSIENIEEMLEKFYNMKQKD